MIFMRDDAAVIEIWPFGFAREGNSNWVNSFYPHLSAVSDYRVWYFSINIDDSELSRPGRWESQGLGAHHEYPRDRWGFHPST